MNCAGRSYFTLLAFILLACAAPHRADARAELARSPGDPFGYPRPANGQTDVPVRTSIYLELKSTDPSDPLLTESIGVTLAATRGKDRRRLITNGRPTAATSGTKLWSGGNWREHTDTVSAYIEPDTTLLPDTTYTVTVSALTRKGSELAARNGSWSFHTERRNPATALTFAVNLTSKPVTWHGGFFQGFCNPGFCTSAAYLREPCYELMDRARIDTPEAWSLQRDFSLTECEYSPGFLPVYKPNIVRERETRRITSISETSDGLRLSLEDFLGHEQYGIPSARPIADDYHAGDTVLIVAKDKSATATIASVQGTSPSVLLSTVSEPIRDWKAAYDLAPATTENPDAPGIFPVGGLHLVKLKPTGTPCYYWGRVDKEWDPAVWRHNRRLIPSFCEAPGDTSLDGRNGNAPKDYAELHEAVRAIATHIIRRYGAASTDFQWSVLNEPDLGFLFFRAGFDEALKYYDYATDAILRAFEDEGYDSNRIVIGGLELADILVFHSLCDRFLRHCSPATTDTLGVNAAFADPRLDGKRSRRLEQLCATSRGAGAPCDFVSVHCYNTSRNMARKLAMARQSARRIDPAYYRNLDVDAHEACPDWAPPSDPAASDSYLGNGYFESWCADVVRRQIADTAATGDVGRGHAIFTFWPWLPRNMRNGSNDCFMLLGLDTKGGIRKDATATIAMPAFYVANAIESAGKLLWPLPEEHAGGLVVSGFVGKDSEKLTALLYTHGEFDPQSRLTAGAAVRLNLQGLHPGKYRVSQDYWGGENSPFYALARKSRPTTATFSPEESERLGELATATRPDRIISVNSSGMLRLEAALMANAVTRFVIRPEAIPR